MMHAMPPLVALVSRVTEHQQHRKDD